MTHICKAAGTVLFRLVLPVALARIQCVYCDKIYTGGVNRIRVHLTGEGNSIAKCASAPDAVVAEMMECNKERVRLELSKKMLFFNWRE